MNWLEDVYAWVFRDVAKEDPFFMFTAVVSAWALLVFWIGGSVYMAVDLIPTFKRYKIQPEKNNPLEVSTLKGVLPQICFNMFVLLPLFTLGWAKLMIWRGNPYLPEEMYFGRRLLIDIVIIALCEEFGFYYTHRLVHEFPVLYKWIHKRHHEMTAPFAITAVYAHPIEHLMSNMMPIALGPIMSGCHAYLVFIWVGVALTTTLTSHSGYHLPFCTSPEKHDYHHRYAITGGNYGPLGLLDALHGTSDNFKSSIQCQRDKVLLSFTPLRDQIPDPPKKQT